MYSVTHFTTTHQRKTTMTEIKHAWRSKKFEALVQDIAKLTFLQSESKYPFQVVYRTPDGNELTCNFVSPTADSSGTHWDDVEYLGEVTTFVRSYILR